MTMNGRIAVARLAKWKGQGNYGLGSGDKNPNSPSPFEWKNGYYACDCSSAVLWAYGCPKHHPNFPEYEGDINVDSALMDAGAISGGRGSQQFFTEIHDPESVLIGDMVAFPSVRAYELHDTTYPPQTRLRIGHIGLIAGWRAMDQSVPDENKTPWHGNIADFIVVECSSGWPAIKFGYDKNFHVRENRTVCIWKGVTTTNNKWRTRIIRYIGP